MTKAPYFSNPGDVASSPTLEEMATFFRAGATMRLRQCSCFELPKQPSDAFPDRICEATRGKWGNSWIGK